MAHNPFTFGGFGTASSSNLPACSVEKQACPSGSTQLAFKIRNFQAEGSYDYTFSTPSVRCHGHQWILTFSPTGNGDEDKVAKAVEAFRDDFADSISDIVISNPILSRLGLEGYTLSNLLNCFKIS